MISILSVLIGSFIFILFVGVFYVVYALGIKKLMIAEGLPDTYRAWVPFWNSFVLGEILEQETADFQFTFQNTTKWIVCLGPLFTIVPFVGNIASAIAGIYVFVLCAVMASKQGTTASMIISSLFCLSGIGFMIYANKVMERDPGRKMEEKDPFAAPPSQDEPEVVDFTVEPANEKSAPQAAATKADVVVEKAPSKETIYAKPEGSKGTIVATPDNKMGTIEANPRSEVAFQESVDISGDTQEFDVPLGDDKEDGQYVEFDIIEE